MCTTMPGLLVEMGSLLTFFPGWTQIKILLIFNSQVAGITGKHQQVWLMYFSWLIPSPSESQNN
jgi:hypothetical protein